MSNSARGSSKPTIVLIHGLFLTPRSFEFVPLWGILVFLAYRMRRVDCTRCGVTGLRPTFGRVSRYGCMSLSWSMDKIGPIARSVEDCALVFGTIHGADGLDPTAVDRPFSWPLQRDLRSLRVGYVEGAKPVKEREELSVLRDLGVKLVPIKLPDQQPVAAARVAQTWARRAGERVVMRRRSSSRGA